MRNRRYVQLYIKQSDYSGLEKNKARMDADSVELVNNKAEENTYERDRVKVKTLRLQEKNIRGRRLSSP